jgi:hypothetical protein
MLEGEAASIVPEDVLVATVTAHPYTVADFLVCREGTQAWVPMLADQTRTCGGLYPDARVVVLSDALRAGTG